MCNLQSNLKLNERRGGEGRRERTGGGRKRGTRVKEETRHTGECEGRESSASILSTHGIPPGSLQDLFSHCLQKCGERDGKRKKGETAQCSRGSRDIVGLLARALSLSFPLLSSFSRRLANAFRSHRNLAGFSLFLASRACENSAAQDAIGARRVVEDVQETSYRANYLRLTTLPVGAAEELLLPCVFPRDLSENSATTLTQVHETRARVCMTIAQARVTTISW